MLKYRKKIDKIDSEIINLLEKRLKIVEKLGEYKIKNNLKIHDKQREQEIFNRLKIICEKKGLDEKYINKVFKTIIEHSRIKQNGKCKL